MIKCELYHDNFQNYKSYNIPRAQLILTDIPYNLGKTHTPVILRGITTETIQTVRANLPRNRSLTATVSFISKNTSIFAADS